jgi:hypothetical protein
MLLPALAKGARAPETHTASATSSRSGSQHHLYKRLQRTANPYYGDKRPTTPRRRHGDIISRPPLKVNNIRHGPMIQLGYWRTEGSSAPAQQGSLLLTDFGTSPITFFLRQLKNARTGSRYLNSGYFFVLRYRYNPSQADSRRPNLHGPLPLIRPNSRCDRRSPVQERRHTPVGVISVPDGR